MSSHRTRPPVIAVAVLAPMVPAGLLAAQVAWMVARLTAAQLRVGVVAVAAATAVGWGAWNGVRRPPAPTFVRRLAARAAAGAGLVAAGFVVRRVAVPIPAPDGGGTGGPGALDAATIGVVAALLPFVLLGRALGRTYRRQADPRATTQQRRDADRAVPVALLIGVATVGLTSAIAWAAGVDGLLASGGAPLAWFAVTAIGAAVARGVVLDARSGPSVAPDLVGWVRRSAPLALGVVAVTLVGALAVRAAGDAWPPGWLPTPPIGVVDALDDPATDRAAVDAPAPAPTPGSLTSPVAWVLLMAGAVLLLLMVMPRPRRRVRVWRTGVRTSLLELLRELFAPREVHRRRGDSDEVAIAGREAEPARVLPGPLAAWARRLRPRPREPAAAIMYDYRRVQDRLPPDRRRRRPETVLAHARRVDATALDELADLVCAIRYADRTVTAADAERSRQLVRTLTRR